MSNRHHGKRTRVIEFLLPGEGQHIGIVTKNVGNGHYMVTIQVKRDEGFFVNQEINARLRGTLARKKMPLNSIVIVEPYLNVNSIIYIYQEQHIKILKEDGLVPKITSDIASSSTAEDDENGFDFDHI
jgi:hypothetical protein